MLQSGSALSVSVPHCTLLFSSGTRIADVTCSVYTVSPDEKFHGNKDHDSLVPGLSLVPHSVRHAQYVRIPFCWMDAWMNGQIVFIKCFFNEEMSDKCY